MAKNEKEIGDAVISLTIEIEKASKRLAFAICALAQVLDKQSIDWDALVRIIQDGE